MPKLLSIVVPYYTEPLNVIAQLLESIDIQRNINMADVEILLVDDCAPTSSIPPRWLQRFRNLNCRLLKTARNAGCGVARQVGIDNAAGKYIMMMDADDSLWGCNSLAAMRYAARESPDLITSKWYEEIPTNADATEMTTCIHQGERTWVFGKWYRKQWLDAANIRFHPDFRWQEDSYFNQLAFNFCNSHIDVDEFTYLWRFNPDSTVRANNGVYAYDSATDFVHVHAAALAEFEKRDKRLVRNHLLWFVAFHYCQSQRREWLERGDKREWFERAFAKAVKPFWHYYQAAPLSDVAASLSSVAKDSLIGEIPLETLPQWLTRLGLDYNFIVKGN